MQLGYNLDATYMQELEWDQNNKVRLIDQKLDEHIQGNVDVNSIYASSILHLNYINIASKLDLKPKAAILVINRSIWATSKLHLDCILNTYKLHLRSI